MHPSIDRIFSVTRLAVALLRVVRRLFERRQQSRRGARAVLFENPAEGPEGTGSGPRTISPGQERKNLPSPARAALGGEGAGRLRTPPNVTASA